MATRTMVYVGRDRVQVGPWKVTGTTANLIPYPERDRLSVDAVHKAIDEAVDRGFTNGYTAALSPSQAEPFFEAGFVLHEELHLLRRELGDEVNVTRGSTRRARRIDWDEVLELDALAFQDFWQFDRVALADAVRATPRHRFQVIKSAPVFGYHITGLAGLNAYIQRVAVHPDAQRLGYGAALVNDSLRWAWRNGATTVQVNTQITNDRAVGLYERCGFTFAPHRLLVLHHDFVRDDRGEAATPPIYT
ncbi:GNAT family N-acetyltransferase [bacterium]|nr:GNAT family N-acetyltransferase [bacterium]